MAKRSLNRKARIRSGVAIAVRTSRYKKRVHKNKKNYSRKARRDDELP